MNINIIIQYNYKSGNIKTIAQNSFCLDINQTMPKRELVS